MFLGAYPRPRGGARRDAPCLLPQGPIPARAGEPGKRGARMGSRTLEHAGLSPPARGSR